MSAHHHYTTPKQERFVSPKRFNTILYAMMAVGILSLAYGFITNPQRAWANILINDFYFMGISLCGLVFVAIACATNAGWSIGFKRIPEAFSSFLPIAGLITLIIAGGAALHLHHLYHWTDHELYVKTLENGQPNPLFDEILYSKKAFLNLAGFIIFTFVGFGIWIGFQRVIVGNSLKEDAVGGIHFLKRNKTLSSIFLPLYAISWAFASWYYMMSLDPHWFSTIYWVYQFASTWVACIALIIVALILMKREGYFAFINENHLHDLGKMMFGFSVFWTYIWLAQFLLIYYANIPEEAVYYYERWESPLFYPIFFINLIANFIFPFFYFMTRDAKRRMGNLLFGASVVFLGHWLDMYQQVMPAAVGHESGLGIPEFGTLIGFLGLFVFVVKRHLAKHALVPVKHPYLKEFTYHAI